MELLEDHFYTGGDRSLSGGYTYTFGEFTVYSGNVLDFKSTYGAINAVANMYLYRGSTLVAEANCLDNGGNIVLMHREYVSSSATFYLKWYSDNDADLSAYLS